MSFIIGKAVVITLYRRIFGKNDICRFIIDNAGIFFILKTMKMLWARCNMKIRKFEERDLPQVLELCREVRDYHIKILGGYFVPQDDDSDQCGFMESLNNNKIIALVAEKNDVILGYLQAEYKYSPHLLNPKVAHISNIGVKEGLRGRGLGRKMLSAFYEICRRNDIDEIKLGVFNKNVAAYKFYEKCGFEPLEQRMRLRIIK